MSTQVTSVPRHRKRREYVAAEHRRGTAATEFALCIPLVILLALACADFGRIAHFHQVVCNAARTGAETGATHKFTPLTKSAWEAGVRQAVMAEMQNIPNFDAGELNFQQSTVLDSDNLARIEVTVSYPFRTVVAWPGLPSEVILRKNVEYRQFR
jgi:Flp pilus assembly protein TadG